jgi:hypothetical protein
MLLIRTLISGKFKYTFQRPGEWKEEEYDRRVRREPEPGGKKTKLQLIHSRFAYLQGGNDHDEG